jgi:hypothetical protein
MPIFGSQHGLNQRVCPADAGIHQGQITDVRALRPCRALRELVDPIGLLHNVELVEEVRRDRRRRQGAHRAQSPHSKRQLIASRLADDDGVFGKLQAIGTDRHDSRFWAVTGLAGFR